MGLAFFCLPSFHWFAERGEENQNKGQCGNEKILAAENDEAKEASANADHCGGIVLCFFQKVEEENNKERGHGKANALCIKMKERSDESSGGAADDPIGMIQKADEKKEPAPIHAGGRIFCAKERIGFIGEGEDHIILLFPHIPKLIDERKAVKKVPGIDHQGDKSDLQKLIIGNEKIDGNKLHGAGIHGETHQK